MFFTVVCDCCAPGGVSELGVNASLPSICTSQGAVHPRKRDGPLACDMPALSLRTRARFWFACVDWCCCLFFRGCWMTTGGGHYYTLRAPGVETNPRLEESFHSEPKGKVSLPHQRSYGTPSCPVQLKLSPNRLMDSVKSAPIVSPPYASLP